MRYFHFERLIKKYSREITAIIPARGKYVDGEYVAGKEKRITLNAAILDIDKKKIYGGANGSQVGGSGATLTAQDKQLYVIGTLTEDIIGAKIIHEGKEYNVEQDTDNSFFTNFAAYILKYVSAFGGVNND